MAGVTTSVETRVVSGSDELDDEVGVMEVAGAVEAAGVEVAGVEAGDAETDSRVESAADNDTLLARAADDRSAPTNVGTELTGTGVVNTVKMPSTVVVKVAKLSTSVVV